MGDITITIPLKTVFREVARRSAVATETDPFYAGKSTEEKQYSQLQGEGDRITNDFVKEAAKEVLKAYLSRQGDVAGTAFEYGSMGVSVKQQEQVEIIGGEGSFSISGAGLYKSVSVAYDSVLADVTAAFVTSHAADYLAAGVVITSSENKIIFEARIAGVAFDSISTSMTSGSVSLVVTKLRANSVSTSDGYITYRFSENEVPLSTNQTNAIINRLTNNTKDAIIYYVLVSLYRTDGNQKKEAELLAKALSLIDELSGDLYRLHD